MLKDMDGAGKVFDEETINILNIFTILMKVRDYGNIHLVKSEANKQAIDKAEVELAQTAKNFRKSFQEAGRALYPHIDAFTGAFEHLLLQIEVNCSGMQYVYFPYNPVFKFLAKDTKNRIMAEVNR